jgi:hypothetical protein
MSFLQPVEWLLKNAVENWWGEGGGLVFSLLSPDHGF